MLIPFIPGKHYLPSKTHFELQPAMPDFSIVYVLVNPAMPGLVKIEEIPGDSPRVLRELLAA